MTVSLVFLHKNHSQKRTIMERQSYNTDLSDAQWEQIEALFPASNPQGRGRPRKWSYWEIFNAILYVLRTGCH